MKLRINYFKRLIFFYLLTFYSLVQLSFAGVTVICHQNAPVTPGDVVEIFNAEKTSVNGVKVQLVENKAIQDQFLSQVMQNSFPSYNRTWAKKSFQEGLTVPPVKNSDQEVIDFVKSTEGGCGYIGGAAPGNVKTIHTY